MRQPQNGRRFGEIMIGLLLILAGISAIGGAQLFLLVLGAVGLFLVLRQANRTSTGIRSSSAPHEAEALDEDELIPPQPRPRADQVYAHALDAVRRAGLDPTETHVLPIDIGVMAFSSDSDPTIYRTRPVLDDVDYIQPFVQLRLPTRARGRIRFELVDSDGQILFIHEEDHEFQRGRNLVTPAARLPIHDAHAMLGDWQLRVSADGVLIAEHHFEWQESTRRVIRRHLTEDGELSSEVRAMVAESRLQRMSLDELLDETDPDQENDNTGAKQSQRR